MAKKTKETLQKFRVLKLWKTAIKTYNTGDSFFTNNEKIINFLTTNKTIEKWD